MFREWYQGAEASGWPLIALLVFFGVFVLVLGYVLFAMSDERDIDRMASLPLDDDASATQSDGGTGR